MLTALIALLAIHPPLNVQFVGDSITHRTLWEASYMERAFEARGLKVIFTGLFGKGSTAGGSKAVHWHNAFRQYVPPADVFCIQLGLNDLRAAQKTPDRGVAIGVQGVLGVVSSIRKSHPRATVIVAVITPVSANNVAGIDPDAVRDFNNALATNVTALKDPKVRFSADWWASYEGTFYSEDGLHPSKEGFTALAERWATIVEASTSRPQ